MALPSIFQSGNKWYGFTEVYVYPEKSKVVITHTGNMGHSIIDVRKNFDHIYGDGVFLKMYRKCRIYTDYGSPDYYFEREMYF